MVLYYVIICEYEDVVKYLWELGVDVLVVDSDGVILYGLWLK